MYLKSGINPALKLKTNLESTMEKIIDKVKKLIALGTNSGATEGERDNAIRMAHVLLAKHNLSMADIAESEKPEEREELFSEYYRNPWYAFVANAMAKLFFCQCYTSKGHHFEKNAAKKTRIYFVGKSSNVITAKLMADYLIKSITKELKKNEFSISFCNGASNKIAHRVEAMIKQPNIEGSSCTALSVVNIYKSEAQANAEFIASKGIALSETNRATRNTNQKEYMAGVSFGGNVSLNNQIGQSRPNITGTLQ
jgi:hypothetical protein